SAKEGSQRLVDACRLLLAEPVTSSGEAQDVEVCDPALQVVGQLRSEVGVKLAPEEERRRGDDAQWAELWQGVPGLAVVFEGGGEGPRPGDRVHIALDIEVGEPGAGAIGGAEGAPNHCVVVAAEGALRNAAELEEADIRTAHQLLGVTEFPQHAGGV